MGIHINLIMIIIIIIILSYENYIHNDAEIIFH